MKIENKMTAIEWLEIEIVKLETKYGIPGEIYQLCDQAKEIEKQQITEAFDSDYDYWFTADNYYELKYKK